MNNLNMNIQIYPKLLPYFPVPSQLYLEKSKIIITCKNNFRSSWCNNNHHNNNNNNNNNSTSLTRVCKPRLSTNQQQQQQQQQQQFE